MVLGRGWMETPWMHDFWAANTGYFATADVTTTPVPYGGRMVGPPTIERRVPDALRGVVELQRVTWELAQVLGYDLTPFALRGFRGRRAILRHHDVALNTYVTDWAGHVETSEITGDGIVRQTGVNVDLGVFETLIPSVLVNTVTWPLAVDVGRAIPVPFGTVRLLRLPCVKSDDANNHYDYLVRGTVTVLQAYQEETSKPTGPSFSLIPTTAYTVSTALYPGYTALRFGVKRTNATGGLVGIWVDCSQSYEFLWHPLYVVRRILVNTVWGLSQTVDETAFITQADVLTSLMGAPMIGFALGWDGRQRASKDWLRDLLMIGACRLVSDPITGFWRPVVGTPPTTLVMHVRDGLGDGPRTIESPGTLVHTSHEDRVKRLLVRYGRHAGANTLAYETVRGDLDSTGRVEIVDNECIADHATADRLAHFLGWRAKDHEERIELVGLTDEGRVITEGDLVGYSYAAHGAAVDPCEVLRVGTSLTPPTVDLARYTLRRWQFVASPTLPTDFLVDIVAPGGEIPTPPIETDTLDSVECVPPQILVALDSSYQQIAGAAHTAAGTLDIVAGSGNTLSATGTFRVVGGFGGGAAVTAARIRITDTFSSQSFETEVLFPTSPVFTVNLVQAAVTAGTHTFKLEAWGAGSGWALLDFIRLTVVESAP